VSAANRKRATRNAIETGAVFISHDSRDADIAALFSELLRTASTGMLKCFRSSDRKGSQGIEYGKEWYAELMRHLQSASDVVCLLSQNSLERPWVLYEAGVAFGKRKAPVLGVALGIPLSRANKGPFAQFQNCADDEESLTTLVMQLVRHIPGADPDRSMIGRQVRAFRKKTFEIIKSWEDEDDPANCDTFLSLGMTTAHKHLTDEKLKERLERARDIKVLKTWFPETEEIATGLKRAIKNGRAKLKLLVCKPSSTLVQKRSLSALKRKWLGPNTIYQAIEDIHKWVRATPGVKVEIGCYDSWPGCPVIWYDRKILMGFYFRGAPSPEWPWVSVKAGSELAIILEDQFDDLWNLRNTIHLTTQKDRLKWLKANKKWKMSSPRQARRPARGKLTSRTRQSRKGHA